MLGCHDFCGHYEWTFHYLRRRWGQEAVRKYWAQAIGGESQRHYSEAGQRAGLRGLYNTWTKTGEDESCDWTFKLDEAQNYLRWDMRACPSKGFLLANDRNADEDYCDHCMGWTLPLIEALGMAVVAHEHNHVGQCWGLMRAADRPANVPELDGDIRRDSRWACGYLDVWRDGQQLPLMPRLGPWTDPYELLEAVVPDCRLTLIDRVAPAAPLAEGEEFLATGRAYATPGLMEEEPWAVVLEHDGTDLAGVATRWLAVPLPLRPLLLHAYLPGEPKLNFTAHRLPRPLPILPLLIRKGLYVHRPGGPYPSPGELATMLVQALGRP
jgi:hypothetical protein